MGGIGDLVVLCDGESDKRLFIDIAKHHPLLAEVRPDQVRTYDQARHLKQASKLEEAIRPLHVDDRPDWIICLGDRPVLVIEMTQHAYTGDNGLQRFARFAAAAENRVPFIYFGPRSRVRDDELDVHINPSRRNLTSDLYAGMRALSSVYQVPQLAIEWKTDGAGLPAALPFRATSNQVAWLYGELLQTISTILTASFSVQDNTAILQDPDITELQLRTNDLADATNTRASDVRFEASSEVCRSIVLNPASLINIMGKGYFSKGKPDKTLAEHCLQIARVSAVQIPDGTIERGGAATAILEDLLRSPKFSGNSQIFYTGYKWRSDPHAGVLVNYDIRSRRPDEHSPKERRRGLIVVYPRVSLCAEGVVARSLAEITLQNPGPLVGLFQDRYAAGAEAKLAGALDASNLFGIWRNSSKQARIFRRYADLIVLNDGVVIGDSLSDRC